VARPEGEGDREDTDVLRTESMIKEISLNSDIPLPQIWDEYVEDMEPIPTEKAKEYFRNMSGKVDPKLVRQCMFAGMYWALKHPDSILIKED